MSDQQYQLVVSTSRINMLRQVDIQSSIALLAYVLVPLLPELSSKIVLETSCIIAETIVCFLAGLSVMILLKCPSILQCFMF